MKKGLRLAVDYKVVEAFNSQNRRPDEEGIKTMLFVYSRQLRRQNRRPDEEGIKTLHCLDISAHAGQNRRPDEEGIKTYDFVFITYFSVRTVDLMKKGLRRVAGRD